MEGPIYVSGGPIVMLVSGGPIYVSGGPIVVLVSGKHAVVKDHYHTGPARLLSEFVHVIGAHVQVTCSYSKLKLQNLRREWGPYM